MGSAPLGAPLRALAWQSGGGREHAGGGEQRERVAELRPHDQRGAQPEDDFESEHAWILADGVRRRGAR